MIAAELTPEHYGLLVTWEEEGAWGSHRRTAVLGELRRWINSQGRQVGILDFTASGAVIGTEHMVSAETQVSIGHRAAKARKRRWSKVPLATWAELETEAV